MAITGIDTIEGKQIIAAGAVSAKSAEMAYNDENGNPITGYQLAGDYYSASNPSGFITGVDLTPYQTTAEMTAYQPAGDYLTTADSAEFYTTANESGFITGVDLTPYQTTAGMTAYQPTGDYLTTADSGNFYPMTGNPSGFINELPEEEEVEFEEIDLADYQPVSSMTAYANSADVTGTAQYGLTTAGWSEITAGGGTVPTGIMVESGLEYDANNKISGYSGSAFAGGTDLEFEYDAADNISAINNSAISTTPAQALYAQNPLYFSATGASSYMGINSADLARLLGVDETVLFESANAVTNAPLSESMTAFNRVRVSLANDFTDTGLYQTVIDLDVEHGSHVWEPVGGLGITNMWVGVNMLSANTDYTILTAPKAKLISFGNWTSQGTAIAGSTTGANVNVILKVIGIGRKEV